MKNHFQNYEKLCVDKFFVDKLFVDKLIVDKLFVKKLFADKFEIENRDLLLVTKNNFSPSIFVLRAEILKETKILFLNFPRKGELKKYILVGIC